MMKMEKKNEILAKLSILSKDKKRHITVKVV